MPKLPTVKQRRVEESREALRQDGATVIYAQGMSMVPATMTAQELSRRIGAPVLDPLRISVQTAEMIARLRLRFTG